MSEVLERLGQGSSAKPLDPTSLHAAHLFVRMLDGQFAIRNVIAFGSRARGNHTPESDLDLAIILNGPIGDRVKTACDMAGTAFDALLETGILVQALPVWAEEFENPESTRFPDLIRAIKREGAHL